MALASVLLCAGCSRSAGRPEVRLATWKGAYVVVLAESLGYFEREHVALSLQEIPSLSKSMEALLGGSVDAIVGTYEQAVQMAAEGRDVKAFDVLLGCHGLILAVSPATQRTLNRIEDLPGATVGVSSPGSSTQFFLNYLLRKHGIAPDSVTPTSIGVAATAIAALERGEADAGVIFGSAFTVLRDRHAGLKVLANTYTKEGMREIFGVTSYPSTALLAKASWLQANPGQARALARAFSSATGWMRTHSPEQIRDRIPAAYRIPDARADLEALRMLIPCLPETGKLSIEEAEAVRKVLSGSVDKVRSAKIDLPSTFTNEFVDAH